MIQLNSKLLVRILTDLRRALGIAKSSPQPVSISTDRGSTTIRMSTAEVAIACQVAAGSRTSQHVALPVNVFATVRPAARQDLSIVIAGENADIESCDDTGVRTTMTEKCLSSSLVKSVGSVPEPEWRICNPFRLGTVLAQAASVSDPTSTRYSLGCIRLRGSDGQVAATDGRQVFAASGFAFPVDEVKIPGEVLGRLSCMANCSSISVGRSADWVTICTANGTLRWQIDLKIQTEGRFPDIDMCFPRSEASRTVVTISDEDAQFLLKNLDRLLGKPVELNAATLDLGCDRVTGKRLVQLRSRKSEPLWADPANTQIVEVTLDGSTFDSVPMRVAMDHHMLLNAIRFGHRQIHLQSPSSPVFCSDKGRKFVWALMHESLTLGNVPNMESISTSRSLAVA